MLFEMPFPKSDQRNTRKSLSKAKKVLLLQKGAATDHSLIGRAHVDGKSTQIIFLMNDSLSLTRTGPCLGSQHSTASYCLG
jgi:hypothetical protein